MYAPSGYTWYNNIIRIRELLEVIITWAYPAGTILVRSYPFRQPRNTGQDSPDDSLQKEEKSEEPQDTLEW